MRFVAAVEIYFGWKRCDIMSMQLVRLDEIIAGYEIVLAALPETHERAEIEARISKVRGEILLARSSIKGALEEVEANAGSAVSAIETVTRAAAGS